MKTKQELLKIALAIYQTVAELGSAPSGTIYATLMNQIDLHTYQDLIQMLKDIGKIKEVNHVLVAVR
jgi:hypothetical protein